MTNKTWVLFENREFDDLDFEEDYDLEFESKYEIKSNDECYWSEISYHHYGELNCQIFR